MRKAILIILMQLISSNALAAGGLDNFMKYAGRSGSMTSINKGAIINDQRAGYMTGGSIITRGPRPMELQPLNIQLPSMEFDPCTGSGDLRWGGFSFIKGQEFAKYFKALAASSGTYVAKMLIKQACPQCEDIISYLESVARDINGMTFGQCEQAKAIADGFMGKFNSANNQKCLTKSSLARGGSDLAEATQKCQDNPDRYGEIGDDNELKAMLPDNFNLVWKALSHGNGSAPTGMKELIMSISGSIIGSKEGKISTISALPSLIEKEDLLEHYIGKPTAESMSVKLYVCNEQSKCLKPTVQSTVINSRNDSLYGKVTTNLKSILEKVIANEGELTDEEQALIEYSQIPIINLLELELRKSGQRSVEAMIAGTSEFVEVICYDMVINFMEKMLAEAKEAVDELKTAQLDESAIQRFNRNVDNVQQILANKKDISMKKLHTIVAVKERLGSQNAVSKVNIVRTFKNIGR